MTTLTATPLAAPITLTRMMHDAPATTRAALALIFLSLPFFGALALDVRTIADLNPWIKPLKFSASLALYLLTLSWFAYLLPDRIRQDRRFRIYVMVVLSCIALEMLWIAGAAFVGTTSHFNVSTPFWAASYTLMGLAAVTLTSASLVWGWIIWRNQRGRFSRLVAASLVMTFVLTLPTAGYLSAHGSHFVGTAMSDAGGLWPFGWSREIGDLRVAHFFATHTMQIVPLAYAILLWLAGARLPKGTGTGLTAAFSVFTLATFLQALDGKPFLGAL